MNTQCNYRSLKEMNGYIKKKFQDKEVIRSGNLKDIQCNGKKKKGQTVKCETLHRKLKTEQHDKNQC